VGKTDNAHAVTLRFAHEVRSETDYFSDIPEMKLPTEKLAQLLILAVAASAATGLLWIATEIKPWQIS